MLEEQDWDADNELRKFKYILFSNWSACNSACRYCWRDEKDFLIEDVDSIKVNPKDTYDIIPIVRDLIEKNLLSEDATIDFAGGEPTMYYKFDEALRMFIDAKIRHIIINTNAINYSKEIERAVKEGVADVVVSIDAGSKEVHQKVKRVVSFDRVWENLTRYCLAKQPQHTNTIRSKYIIIPRINDSKDEIKKWLDKARETNSMSVVLNADDRMFVGEPNLDDFRKVQELCDFFLEEVHKEPIEHFVYHNIMNIYKQLGITSPQYTE